MRFASRPVPVVLSRLSPEGRLPEFTDHEALLIDEASRAEYAVPTVPDGREVVVIVIVVLSA